MEWEFLYVCGCTVCYIIILQIYKIVYSELHLKILLSDVVKGYFSLLRVWMGSTCLLEQSYGTRQTHKAKPSRCRPGPSDKSHQPVRNFKKKIRTSTTSHSCNPLTWPLRNLGRSRDLTNCQTGPTVLSVYSDFFSEWSAACVMQHVAQPRAKIESAGRLASR